MKRLILIALLIFMCSLNFFGQARSAQNIDINQTELSNEDYAIWSEIFCGWEEILVIRDDTIPLTYPLTEDKKYSLNKYSGFVKRVQDFYIQKKDADVTNKIFNDFNKKNDKSYLLENNFSSCKDYILVSKAELSSIFEKSTDGWKDFQTKYRAGGGYARISRVGFSPDKKQAIIFLKQECGLLCDSGDFYFFVKENDEWIEKARENISSS